MNQQSSFWSEDRRARASRSPHSEKGCTIHGEGSRSRSLKSPGGTGRGGSCGKTCRVRCHQTEEGILVPSSGRWLNSGMGSPTEFWTQSTSESRSDAVASTLSLVLESGPHLSTYFLTARAGGGDCEEAATQVAHDPGRGKSDFQHGDAGGWWNGKRVSQTLDAVLYKKQCLPEKNRFPAVLVPAWVRCGCCEDFICQAHGRHAYECRCKSIEHWADADASPYEPCLLRYVTPLECERLMGLPDEYTLIDSASDSKRYKAIGNSMAVPVMRWIGARIDAVEKSAGRA